MNNPNRPLCLAERPTFTAVAQRLEAADELDAGPLFPGLRIDLEEIWAG